MNKILPFLKLIRFNNIVIIALTQYLIKYSIINYFVDDFTLSNLNFFLLVLSTTLIASAGYIINDIYDIKTDIINRKNKFILENHISIKKATRYYIVMNILALMIGCYLAFYIQIPILSIIFIYCIASLWLYSSILKKKILIGNIQVAILTSLPIINIILFDILPNGINTENGEYFVFIIILIYAVFALLTNLIREIIKDIQDIKGDTEIKATTLPIKYGINIAKNTSLILIVLVMISIVYFQYFQYSVINSEFEYKISIWGVNSISIIYTIIIQIAFILLFSTLYKAQKEKEFYSSSILCKIIMILGILSAPLFTYLHLN